MTQEDKITAFDKECALYVFGESSTEVYPLDVVDGPFKRVPGNAPVHTFKSCDPVKLKSFEKVNIETGIK